MFKLWKHKNGYWYVLHGPRGRQRVSTGTKSHAEAKEYLSAFIAGSREPALTEPTVAAILEAYGEATKGEHRSEAGKYASKALTRHIGQLEPHQLTPTQMKRYALERGVKPGTILREIGYLRASLTWAHSHDLIKARKPIFSPVQAPPPRDRWLTRDEVKRLFTVCSEPHLRLFITLGLTTCARTSAILEAKWSQVDFEAGVIDYGPGHGNKKRSVVPIKGQAERALRAAKELACTEYLIEYHGKPVKSVKRGFASACARAKIEGVTPHILRHTGATWAVMEGRSLAEVARLLGDSERTVERTYAKHSPDYLRETVDALQWD